MTLNRYVTHRLGSTMRFKIRMKSVTPSIFKRQITQYGLKTVGTVQQTISTRWQVQHVLSQHLSMELRHYSKLWGLRLMSMALWDNEKWLRLANHKDFLSKSRPHKTRVSRRFRKESGSVVVTTTTSSVSIKLWLQPLLQKTKITLDLLQQLFALVSTALRPQQPKRGRSRNVIESPQSSTN